MRNILPTCCIVPLMPPDSNNTHLGGPIGNFPHLAEVVICTARDFFVVVVATFNNQSIRGC